MFYFLFESTAHSGPIIIQQFHVHTRSHFRVHSPQNMLHSVGDPSCGEEWRECVHSWPHQGLRQAPCRQSSDSRHGENSMLFVTFNIFPLESIIFLLSPLVSHVFLLILPLPQARKEILSLTYFFVFDSMRTRSLCCLATTAPVHIHYWH
jgi:hypothetical protein